jgi:Zn-dependent protease with chaperone function
MYPQLYNVVEEMKIASSLPGMPAIYIFDDPAANAFAVGSARFAAITSTLFDAIAPLITNDIDNGLELIKPNFID